MWPAFRRPWENSLAPCVPTGTHSPPENMWLCLETLGCWVESDAAARHPAVWPQVQGWLQTLDSVDATISETLGHLPGKSPPVPGRSLSGCPHLTSLVQCAPPAASPAPGHSAAGLTPSLYPRQMFSVCVREIRSL